MRAVLGALLLLGVVAAARAEPVEVAPGVFVLTGLHEDATPRNANAIANTGFIVGDAAVAVIDPGGSLAHGRQLRAAIAAATTLPIRYVVFTHVHPDHILGAAAFTDAAPEFIGHARLPGALAQRGAFYERTLRRSLGEAGAAGSTIVAPTRLVTDRLDLDLGNRRLTLRAHRPAHTDNDISVLDHRSATLWLGDLLFVARIPVVDGSLAGWIREMETLQALPAARAVPGHGPASVPWPAAATDQLRYLNALAHETRAAIARGVTIDRAPDEVGRTEAGRWLLFDSYHARNATTAYKELEWE